MIPYIVYTLIYICSKFTLWKLGSNTSMVFESSYMSSLKVLIDIDYGIPLMWLGSSLCQMREDPVTRNVPNA